MKLWLRSLLAAWVQGERLDSSARCAQNDKLYWNDESVIGAMRA